ncbi:MAG: hydroxyacylglutathione hydrolase, partial [Gaiellaceae bacterium]|nr:hydroxyacylglutathione hydrolase [Gaiellaceae bacterium]
ADHVAGDEELLRRFGLERIAFPVAEPLATGGLRIVPLPTPGHSPDGVAFLVDDTVCFSGDTLFAGSVGGSQSSFADLRRSVMDVLLALPPEVRVLPGHTDATTVAREWEENPFVRVWRGADPEGTAPCRVNGEPATLVVWGGDYDGGHKAWVRFPDGRDAIVGGSRVQR